MTPIGWQRKTHRCGICHPRWFTRESPREALASHAFQVIDADGDGLATLGRLE